jgi:hypothetical protein
VSTGRQSRIDPIPDRWINTRAHASDRLCGPIVRLLARRGAAPQLSPSGIIDVGPTFI